MLMQVVEIFYDHGQDRYSLREAQVNTDFVEFTRPNKRISLNENYLPPGMNMGQPFTDIHLRSGSKMTIVGDAKSFNAKQLLRG